MYFWESMIKLNEHIRYQDDFLPKKIINDIYDESLNGAWKKQTSVNEKDVNWFWELGYNHAQHSELLKTFVNNEVLRIYINGQSYSQHGDFHHDDGEETYLIGLNKNWTAEKGGATEFLLENNTSLSIYPLYNRAIIFNSMIYHRALPNLHKEDFRMTLAIKTRRKK